MKDKKTNWVKAYIVDIMPIMSLFLYILAFIYNISYYSVFGINIIPYISLSELLLGIIEPLIIIFFLILLGVFLDWNLLIMISTKKEPMTPKYLFYYKICRFRVIMRKIGVSKVFGYIIDLLYPPVIEAPSEQDNFIYLRLQKIIKKFSIPFILIMLSGIIFSEKAKYTGADYGLSMTTLGLPIPCFVFLAYLMIGGMSRKAICRILDYFKEIKKSDIFVIFFLYYLYSFLIFYYSGIESGNYYKEHNRVKFELKDLGGNVYDDNTYRYVGQTNSVFFLLDKKSSEISILNNNGIVYARILNTGESISLIAYTLKKREQKDEGFREWLKQLIKK